MAMIWPIALVVFSNIIYHICAKGLPKDMNTMALLGISVVGLEVGVIYAYKAGWAVNTASIVQSVFVAVALIFVGAILYNEGINANKIIGIVICLVGLYFINK